MPIVLKESNIDLILGMSWLRKAKAVIHCAKRTVELTSPNGDRFEVMVTLTPSTKPAIYLVDGKFLADISVWLGNSQMSFQKSYLECHHIGK
jgi:hypothetical protein